MYFAIYQQVDIESTTLRTRLVHLPYDRRLLMKSTIWVDSNNSSLFQTLILSWINLLALKRREVQLENKLLYKSIRLTFQTDYSRGRSNETRASNLASSKIFTGMGFWLNPYQDQNYSNSQTRLFMFQTRCGRMVGFRFRRVKHIFMEQQESLTSSLTILTCITLMNSGIQILSFNSSDLRVEMICSRDWKYSGSNLWTLSRIAHLITYLLRDMKTSVWSFQSRSHMILHTDGLSSQVTIRSRSCGLRVRYLWTSGLPMISFPTIFCRQQQLVGSLGNSRYPKMQSNMGQHSFTFKVRRLETQSLQSIWVALEGYRQHCLSF